MSVNVELLDRTLAHIEAQPSTWEQRTYRCESGLCFAGWTCELSGARWAVPDADGLHASYVVAVDGDDQQNIYDLGPGLRVTHAADRARRLLGLTTGQTGALFNGRNTLDDLRRIVADIKAAS